MEEVGGRGAGREQIIEVGCDLSPRDRELWP